MRAVSRVDRRLFAVASVSYRHFRDTMAVSALRVLDFGGIYGRAGLLRSCATDRARWERLGGGSLCQFAVAAAASGLMWANMLRPFQIGKARTSHDGASSWIRESRVASAQESWPACHFTNKNIELSMPASDRSPHQLVPRTPDATAHNAGSARRLTATSR